MKLKPVFDIDETFETWIMSKEHFEEMANFYLQLKI
jgi:hypothetical protein